MIYWVLCETKVFVVFHGLTAIYVIIIAEIKSMMWKQTKQSYVAEGMFAVA